MIVKLLTEHHLEFLSLKGGCRGSSESTLVKLLEISCRGSNVFKLLCLLQVLKSSLGMVAPDVEIADGKGTILISSEEGETQGQYNHSLIGS